jgi:hypothetical protein
MPQGISGREEGINPEGKIILSTHPFTSFTFPSEEHRATVTIFSTLESDDPNPKEEDWP